MLGQESRDDHRVLTVALHSEGQSFDPLQEEERVERAERRPDVALTLHSSLDDVGDVGAKVLDIEDVSKNQSVIARIGLGEAGELTRRFPVERSAIDDD